jgi:hypothetical protein
MIHLNEHINLIEEFIQQSIVHFKQEHGNPGSIGIYGCPWAGWISINFNRNLTIEETENNCPDFEFVEYDTLELPQWQEEYENEAPEFMVNGQTIRFNHNDGDEKLNELIFNYLKPIILGIKEKHNTVFLLQMLDSLWVEIL